MAREYKVMVRLDDKELKRLTRLTKRAYGIADGKMATFLRFLLNKAK